MSRNQKVIKLCLRNFDNEEVEEKFSLSDIYYLLRAVSSYYDNCEITKISLLNEYEKVKSSIRVDN